MRRADFWPTRSVSKAADAPPTLTLLHPRHLIKSRHHGSPNPSKRTTRKVLNETPKSSPRSLFRPARFPCRSKRRHSRRTKRFRPRTRDPRPARETRAPTLAASSAGQGSPGSGTSAAQSRAAWCPARLRFCSSLLLKLLSFQVTRRLWFCFPLLNEVGVLLKGRLRVGRWRFAVNRTVWPDSGRKAFVVLQAKEAKSDAPRPGWLLAFPCYFWVIRFHN